MSGRNVSDLPRPAAQYRVDTANVGKGRFETKSQARREDQRRTRGLIRAIARHPDDLDAPRADRIAKMLDQRNDQLRRFGPPDTLASSMRMREYRIAVIGALLRLICDAVHAFTTCTIIPKSFELTPAEFQRTNPANLMAALRSALYRAGAQSVRGWLFAYLHGEFDPVACVFRLHVHLVCSREMVPVIDRLRKMRNFKSERKLEDGSWSPVYRRVWIRRKPLFDMPYPLTYVMQSFWPSRPIYVDPNGKRRRVRDKRAIPEPYHSQVLLWMDRWELKDLTLMIGLRVTTAGLQETRP